MTVDPAPRRELQRGAVYKALIELPPSALGNPPGSEVLDKFMVVLQGGPAFAAIDRVAVVLISTRRSPEFARPFEVLLDSSLGFDFESVVDGRWVMTILKQDIPEYCRYRNITLPIGIMEDISGAIVNGLQL